MLVDCRRPSHLCCFKKTRKTIKNSHFETSYTMYKNVECDNFMSDRTSGKGNTLVVSYLLSTWKLQMVILTEFFSAKPLSFVASSINFISTFNGP